MQSIKISQLEETKVLGDEDAIPVVRNGQTKKFFFTLIKNIFKNAVFRVNDEGHLTETYDGTTNDLGLVRGEKGERGLTGATGPTGAQGPKGDKGDKGDPGEGVQTLTLSGSQITNNASFQSLMVKQNFQPLPTSTVAITSGYYFGCIGSFGASAVIAASVFRNSIYNNNPIISHFIVKGRYGEYCYLKNDMANMTDSNGDPLTLKLLVL